MHQRLKIGITGAGGNIGSTLITGLRDEAELRAFDIRAPRKTDGMDWQIVDCAEAGALDGAFRGLDVVIHLAGNPSPAARRADTLRQNFVGTSRVFEAARADGVRKVVFASSNFYHQRDIAEALHSRDGRLIRLDDCATPDCAYAESKVYGENLGFHYAQLGLQCAALRIGWTVPGDSPVPYDSPYMRAMFCSHRDLVQAFRLALEVDAPFLTAFAISNNTRKVFDLTETERKLGFRPQDDAEDHF